MTAGAPDRVPIVVPQMGVVESILVLEWLVAPGEAVTAGQPVVSVDTEKSVTDIEAPASGSVEIAVPAGDDEIPVGTVLGYVTVG